MPMTCTSCGGTGFLNIEQVPEAIAEQGIDEILSWMHTNQDHDVTVCDCCGNGDDWYGEPGYHYGADDPAGPHGPYGYNGGLCECH